MIVQQNETAGIVRERRANCHQGVHPHVLRCFRIGIREQMKGIDPDERRLIDPDGPIEMPGKRCWQRCPGGSDFVEVSDQGVVNVGTDAVYMDMQLILSAALHGVYRQR